MTQEQVVINTEKPWAMPQTLNAFESLKPSERAWLRDEMPTVYASFVQQRLKAACVRSE